MRKMQKRLILTFPSTAAAMAFEDACRENSIPGRLIPLPREISAGCGLCWMTDPSELKDLRHFLQTNRIIAQDFYELFL